MVSDSCKKRFGKIMMEEMGAGRSRRDRSPHLFYDLEGGNGGTDVAGAVSPYPCTG